VVAVGWADLDATRALAPTSRLPAFPATPVVTVGAVLRLAAKGRLTLEEPANAHLRTVRLADTGVTVGDLPSHSGGIDLAVEPGAAVVRPLLEVAGPVIASHVDRGGRRFSAGGLATLGQLMANLTGQPYPVAASRLVLEPLGMGCSGFPPTPEEGGSDRLTGYHVGLDGQLHPVEPRVATLAAASRLWSTAADLVRLGIGWSSLLPPSLA
jgi:CubicO group peptidase (beta-lactamase class C family)